MRFEEFWAYSIIAASVGVLIYAIISVIRGSRKERRKKEAYMKLLTELANAWKPEKDEDKKDE